MDVNMKRTLEGGLDEDARLTVQVGSIVRTRTESEWDGFELFDNFREKACGPTWTLTFKEEHARTWEEVLDAHERFSDPVQAFHILHYLMADRVRTLPDSLLQEFFETKASDRFWSFWQIWFLHMRLYEPNVCPTEIPSRVTRCFDAAFERLSRADHVLLHECPDPREDDLIFQHVFQSVCDNLERRLFCGAQPGDAPKHIPMHMQFVQQLPRNVVFSGSAAAFVHHVREVPETSDLDFFVFGSTIEQRREGFERFSELIYKLAPNTRTCSNRSITTYLIPGFPYNIQVIYTDAPSAEHVLSKFDITAAKVGLTHVGWMHFRSYAMAWRTKTITADASVKPNRIYKWRRKGFQMCTDVTEDVRPSPNEFRRYTVPFHDPDRAHTNFVIGKVFGVYQVSETLSDTLKNFQYIPLHSTNYDTAKSLIVATDLNRIRDLVQMIPKRPIFKKNAFLPAPFEVDLGVVAIVKVFTNARSSKVSFYIELKTEATEMWFRNFDQIYRQESGFLFATSFNKYGHIQVVSYQQPPPHFRGQSECQMRVTPSYFQDGKIVWTSTSIRNLVFMGGRPALVMVGK